MVHTTRRQFVGIVSGLAGLVGGLNGGCRDIAKERKVSLGFLIAICALLGHASDVRAASAGIRAHDLKLVQGTNRVWRHSEGWLLRMTAPGEVQEGTFALPQKLESGQYRLFVKARNGGAGLRIACGGGTAGEIDLQDRDQNGLWSGAIPLEIGGAAETITLVVTNKSPAEAVNFILQALYFTDRPDVVVDEADCVIRPPEAVPPTDDAPAALGNLIPNSSFEVGLGRGWLFSTPREQRDYSVAALWDETVGRHGRASVRLPAWSSLTSRVFRLRPWKKHSFSVWVHSDAVGASLVMEVANVHQDYRTMGPVTRLSKTFRSRTAGSGWSWAIVCRGFPARSISCASVARITPSGSTRCSLRKAMRRTTARGRLWKSGWCATSRRTCSSKTSRFA